MWQKRATIILLRSSWEGCVRAAIMTLAILSFFTVPVNPLDFGIDLLAELNLYSNYSSYHGVSLTQGYQKGNMAFRLQTNERRLILPAAGFRLASESIKRSSEFTLTAILKQDRGNTGSIIAFSYGSNRYLELESSGKRDEVRFHYSYTSPEGLLLVHTETFSYQLADENWHKVALSVSGPEVQLLIDCHPLYKRVNHFVPDRNFSASNMQLFVGQRNLNNHSMFKGSIQSAHVIAKPHGYLSQCPHMHEQCPTCAQFSYLQRTIEELQKNLYSLTQRLVAAENRVSLLERCDCKISCNINGTIKDDGYEWDNGCNVCKCIRGNVICERRKCDPTPCKNPVYEEGACCPKCLKKCYLRKKEYEHGENHIEGCRNCSCQDGSMRCEKMNCPKLNCSSGQIILAKDECCEVCKDIDECAQQGGLTGNHCHYNTRCVNTYGSYECECLPGYRRLDKFNCVEIDECASGQHACHENAKCINTQGSYHCICKDGYTGDGYECAPICNQTCLHGGQCSAPNVCTCRMGFMGSSCEQDLDECSTGLHSCKESSECVNMHGWYFCKCKTGYHTLGPECIDIDECVHGTHSCHPSAICVNTEGHFRCDCPEDNKDCKLSCIFEDMEVPDGETVSPRNQPCKKCTCKKGVITCEEPKCNCSNWEPKSTRDLCCPQCDAKESCRHQELDHVIFKSGDQWIYQCQTCECLYGEFDCWKLECPPLTCENPLPLEPGDCCQRCPDDPCDSYVGLGNITTAVGKPCTYRGRQYASGQIFTDQSSQCTTCSCKDGQLFCSVDNTCTDNSNESFKVPQIAEKSSTAISSTSSTSSIATSSIYPSSAPDSASASATTALRSPTSFRTRTATTTPMLPRSPLPPLLLSSSSSISIPSLSPTSSATTSLLHYSRDASTSYPYYSTSKTPTRTSKRQASIIHHAINAAATASSGSDGSTTNKSDSSASSSVATAKNAKIPNSSSSDKGASTGSVRSQRQSLQRNVGSY